MQLNGHKSRVVKINGVKIREKRTKDVLLGVCTQSSGTYLGYSTQFEKCGVYLAKELEFAVEAHYELKPFNQANYRCEYIIVINRDGYIIQKDDILIGNNGVCYKFRDELFRNYLNGRNNLQEEHFSDLFLRVEV